VANIKISALPTISSLTGTEVLPIVQSGTTSQITTANLWLYTSTWSNANIATITANLGAYQTYANANLATRTTNFNTLDANIGAFETYANANLSTRTTNFNTLDANVGAFYIYANANIGTLFNGNATTNANLGAFQTYANANLSTRTTNFNTLDANVGTIRTNLNTLDANVGAFETYANTKIGTNTNSNLVVVSATASSSTTTGALVVAGGIGVGASVYAGGNFVSTSDERLKSEIEIITNALAKVRRLRGVTFIKQGDTHRSAGVLAQNVLAEHPEVVSESEDGTLSVAYGNMVGLLIEAIKEQQDQIDELRSKIG